MSRDDLENLYSKSDFGIIPSIQEWVISTNEMMTFGLPVINFKTGSLKILLLKENGFIVDLKNV